MFRTLLFMLLTAPAAAQTPMLLAMRAQDWSLAQALAGANPDPLAAKLVTFIRLLNPAQAGAAELARFMSDNPAWPDRQTLERRYAEALGDEPDAAIVVPLCRSHAPQSANALLRCAGAFALRGDQQEAAHAARAAWTTGLSTPEQEAEFTASWPNVATQTDQITRFDMLERADPAAARRQLARLDPPASALAAARMALRHDDPNALATLPAVPAALRDNPALLLAEARFLRRSQADDAALALWRTALPAAEAATPASLRAPYWTERDALARRLLAKGDAAGAYTLADDAQLASDQAVDADFLAGWIALQRLHDVPRAHEKFGLLLGISHAAITQARALYWLARATPDAGAAHALYLRAASWPLTYYGQLAAIAAGIPETTLHASIAAARDPSPSAAEQAAFAQTEAARAATILANWDDPRRAADFLAQAIQSPASLITRALAAHLAMQLNLPDVAVQAARLAGRDGGALPVAGWPTPYTPPSATAPAALTLGIMRQESSFNPATTSAAGAHGLMQLMPPTANQLARALHIPSGPLADPVINMRLGTAYLDNLLGQFTPCAPCAIAAYNAGPHRVQEWIASTGTPADTETATDWIEQIPFAETRTYVERVLENQTVYAAKGR